MNGWRAGLLAVTSVALTGCATVVPASWVPVDTTAIVGIDADSDTTCWTANVGMATQQGCGDLSWDVEDPVGVFSSSVQKTGADGAVTVYVYDDGQVLAENSTSAEYGVALVVIQPRR